jgi:hypothetical protein
MRKLEIKKYVAKITKQNRLHVVAKVGSWW